MSGEVDRLLAELAGRLRLGRRRERLLLEARDHLLSRVEELTARGADRGEAERQAVSEFGSTNGIVASLPFEMEDVMFARIVQAFAALTSLAALVVILHTLLQREGSASFAAAKLASGAVVIFAGAFALLRVHKASAANGVALLISSASLLVIGAAGAAWTLHLAITTGDTEAWAFAVNGALLIQGAATLAHLWKNRAAPAWS